jgi:uncharacterized protein YaaQ
MKLLICIVNREDTYRLLDAMTDEGFNVTLISTTGGLLRQGNSTLLSGIEDEQVDHALQVIQDNSHSRTRYINPLPPTEFDMYAFTPIEVPVSGAVVFILPVERFERF